MDKESIAVLKWIRTALILYFLLAFVSFALYRLGTGDMAEISANIISNVQGFITGIITNGDLIEYDSFNGTAFILGAILWVLLTWGFWLLSRNKLSLEGQLAYTGKLLMGLGLIVLIVSCIISFSDYLKDPLMPGYRLIFLATLYLPMFILGLCIFMFSIYAESV